MNDVLVRRAKELNWVVVVVNFSLSSFLRAAGYLPMFITLLKKKAFGDDRQRFCRASLWLLL